MSIRLLGRERTKSRTAGRNSLLGLVPLVLLLGVWEIFASTDSVLFPPPSQWWDGWQGLVDTGQFGANLSATLWTFARGLLVATVLGTVLGALIGSSSGIDRATSPTITFLMSIPPAAIVPVAALVVGIGGVTQVGTVVFAAIWPILLNTASAMRNIPGVRLESASLLGLSRRARLTKVVLPSLTPGVALGVLIAAPVAVVVTLLVEMLTSVPGLGSMLLQSQRGFHSAQVFALLVFIGLLGFILNAVITWLESFLLRNWPKSGANA